MTDAGQPYEVITIESWEQFDREVSSLPYREWVFRGHSDARWELKTSLYRLFEDADRIIELHKGSGRKFAKDEHEKLLIARFKSNAHLYLRALPKEDQDLEWLAIMQHFGAPTRLLDATLSPLIASYFAIETGHRDCCVFAFNQSNLRDVDSVVFEKEKLKDVLFENRTQRDSFIVAHLPVMSNERLEAQQGLFLIPSTNYMTFEQLLEYYDLGGRACKKFLVPARLRYEGVERLRRMNITTSSLFPGLDGFCRSLRSQVLEPVKRQKLLGGE